MPHPGNPIYFKETIPADWSVRGYVKFQHERSERTPRQISDGWPRSLRAIADCKDDCCTQDEIDQANVHHGRWKNKKTADRKYLSQWLADQEASRKRAKSMNTFSIGSVGTLFAGPVDNVYNTADGASSSTAAAAGISINNSGGAPTPPTAAAPPTSEPDPAAGAAVPKDKDTFDFQHLLHSFQSTYAAMKTKTLLGSGKYLETEVYTTVMARVAGGFKEMNQLLLWVVSLEDPLVREWFDDGLLEEVRVRVLPMPVVGMEVLYAISGFVRPTTAEEYREHAESGSYRKPGERYDKEKHFDAAWAHNAMRHLITLICDTNNLLLSDDLLEGTLECTLWSPLVDLLLADVFVARRRDSSLQAYKARPDILMGVDPHFDAVVCNHVRARAAAAPTATAPAATTQQVLRAPDEWGVVEVARKNDGRESVKWRKDSLKMLRGLCALMRCAREYVDCDEETVGKLQFPGLLQAGLETMTIRLTCVGHLFVKQEGELRKVPTTVESIPEAFEILESLWLFKKMMFDCQDAIKSYTESKGKRVPPLPTSPNTYCRERMGRPGAL